MAMNLAKVPLHRAVSTRGYSAQAVPISGIFSPDIKTTTLPNKVTVTAVENESAISRVSIMFKAGSRNECPDNLGVTHVLRVAAGLTTKNASQFAIMRHVQQQGASLTCTTNRETIAYTLEGTRESLEPIVPFLTEVATQQEFRPWELDENVGRIKLELATRPPQQRAVDLLHKAAFRTGLGNSLYTSKHQMGKIGSETLLHYVNCFFTGSRTCVAGLGVDHQLLSQYACTLELGSSGETTPPASPYKGGEIRSDKGGNLAFVAIGACGGSTKDLKERFTWAVLQRAYGGIPGVKWAYTDTGVLAKATANTPEPYTITAFNAGYSDAGLFGVLIAADACSAGGAVDGAIKVLKDGSVSDEAVKRGKNQLTREVLDTCESGELIHHMGNVALFTGDSLPSACELIKIIDSISTSDVSSAAKQVAGSKLSMASVGNLRTVPFLSDIH